MVFKKLFGRKKKITALEGPPVKLGARGAPTQAENQANLVAARQSPAFVTVKEWLEDIFKKRADHVVLEYTAAGVAVRYQVDGLWHAMPGRDRESGDPALAVMKKLANLNPKERRAKQQGYFAAKYLQLEFKIHLTAEGTKNGERVLLEIEGAETKLETLDDLGMREKLQEQLKEILNQPSGLFVYSALPGGGLSTTMQGTLRATDRYLRDFVALVDKTKEPLPYVENIEIVEYDPSSDDMSELFRSVMLKEPDVLIIPHISDPTFFNQALEQTIAEGKLLITSLRAKDAVEALLRMLALKIDPEKMTQALRGVLCQRLVRKLCLSCRRPYKPNPQLLQKLGLPPERIQHFFRAFNPKTDLGEDGKPLPPCEVCGGLGYRERTAVFELLVPRDGLKRALLQQPRLEVLRQIARQEGHRGLLEEGLFHVVRGNTSLDELKRALQT